MVISSEFRMGQYSDHREDASHFKDFKSKKDFPSDGSKPKNDQKNEINFFLCNDINGISNENMFQYKYMWVDKIIKY